MFWFPAEAEPARPTECLRRKRVNAEANAFFQFRICFFGAFLSLWVYSDPLLQPMVAVASSKTPYSVRELFGPKSVSNLHMRGPQDYYRFPTRRF